jgi:hypothetical protein
MRRISDLLQGLFQGNRLVYNPVNKNGDNKSNNSKIANQMYNNEYNFYIGDTKQLNDIYESVLNKETSVSYREKILPIEELINEGKPSRAIYEYKKIIKSDEFSRYSKDEKFLVYNGLLNCFICINADDDTVNKWMLKINALGEDIKEIHRYYFLQAIWYYNKHEFEKAIILIEKVVKKKPDYINGLSTAILIKVTKKIISYDEAKEQLNKLLLIEDLGIKDKANIYAGFGDVAFNNRDYSFAKENYCISNKYIKSLSKDIGMAVCEYFDSIKEIREDGTTTLDQIDFKQLDKAKGKFEEIYNNRSNDMTTIVLFAFPFMFNIYSLTNQHHKILEIVEQEKDYIDLKKANIINHIVEAEVIEGIYNENHFNFLGNYEKVKYKSLYYESIKDYNTEIEILLDAIENDYIDKKILQLSLLNALIEAEQFDRYLHYYKKFNLDNQDEVLWMNYIQYLYKKNYKDKVIEEINKLMPIMHNSAVVYDLFMIMLDYDMKEELDIFFNNVNTGKYRIIGLQMPYVLYNKLMHLLRRERYEEYFNCYENTDLDILPTNKKVILEINYFTFKGDYNKTAEAFYKLFRIDNDYEDLLKAVELKINSNNLYDAERYLEFINPMMLKKPEIYYIFKAIILKEKEEIDQAVIMLDEIKDMEFIQEDLESPFHQFYSAFCMNNGKTNEAIKYMGNYYTKNPNPKWFKVIQHSCEDSGEELMKKLSEVVGQYDLSQINMYYHQGIIGMAVYNKIVGNNIDDIIMYRHYPFTSIHITNDNVIESFEKADQINDTILIDANTLAILAKANGLKLLDFYNQVFIPYSAIKIIKQRQSGLGINTSKDILEYLKTSLNVKEVPVDVLIKIKSEENLLPEDILDCIALAGNLKVSYFNTEIYVNHEFDSKYIIDVNCFFYYLKMNKLSARELVALTISNLRQNSFEFISFDAKDLFLCYKIKGIKGIKSFLKMGKNADYKTFVSVYIEALKTIKDEMGIEDFKNVSIEVIRFLDRYVGKTKYYMSTIILKFPDVSSDFEKLIHNCSIRNIFDVNNSYKVNGMTAITYYKLVRSYEFNNILSIVTAFIIFIMQYLNLFSDNEIVFNNNLEIIKQHLKINSSDDIDFIVQFIEIKNR